MTIQVL
ncbi:hypothetical protein NGA_0318500 [Nannochloropsis gaditana CCMP526]|nr:hypothetical protein NGA_0318500 [Nannochloropsis gaditana CCMP526]EKU20305.1 hypothetical protein NGA_0318500 [Nannochloropsis gaditana CCMP526]|eukprot:XP_005856058.1 hypothetical protein NGA_0318500 [Nannochloropsis gaditana CCMP526]